MLASATRAPPASSVRPTSGTAASWKSRCAKACGRAIGTRSGTTTRSGFRGRRTHLPARKSWTPAGRRRCPMAKSVRTLQVDMIAFDNADQSIRAYEIKRGNGQFDAGKIRSITRDLKCIQVLLKSYGEFTQAQAGSGGSKNHLLLRRSVNPAPVVAGQRAS